MRQGRTVQMAYLQHRFANRPLHLGEQVVNAALHHHPDQVVLVGLADLFGADVLAIAQHGHAVGQLEYLVEPMADVDNAHATLAQQPHDVE